MKSIVTVNTVLPTIENKIEYCSGESLRDYDIALFDLKLPYQERIDFSGGGSCISIEGTARIQKAMSHWNRELRSALEAGKTIFVLLSEYDVDLAASGSSYNKGQRTYNTFQINNYQALPFEINVKNTKGKQILVSDNIFKSLYNIIKDVVQYRVIFEKKVGETIYTTKDGATVAAVVQIQNLPGHLVFLPYFDLAKYYQDWTDDDTRISSGIVSQLVAIDKLLRQKNDQTPPPEWFDNIDKPKAILDIGKVISDIESKIDLLKIEKESALESRGKLFEYSHLLYETGKPLESAIEKSLQLLGYTVENYRDGDLEIDHIITSPEGLRMIGESEGKDNAAIDISKFRQLESNINEDFERYDVEKPAKGILFGNGFRLTIPDKREEYFTKKCLVNAKRLGTSLVRTTDLYKVVVYLLDNPQNETFRQACCDAIENTTGEIVVFPSPE